MKYFLTLTLLFVWISAGYAQRDFTNTKITTIPVAGNVYMLQGEGGNMAVSVGDDGVLMVDDQFAPLHEKIQSAIDSLSSSPVKFVLNTHWHGDHTGGNELMSQSGATIIAHNNVRTRLSSKQIREMVGREDEAKPKDAWPVITFDQSVSIHFNGETIDLIHFPNGHTDGDSIVFFRGSNVIHMGDHFFNGAFPYIDLDSGGNVTGYINNVKRILDEISEDTQIIPGHGTLGDKEDLQNFYHMLIQATSRIQSAMDQGQNLEEIQKNALPEEMIAQWGNGFMEKDRWIKILYTSLSESTTMNP